MYLVWNDMISLMLPVATPNRLLPLHATSSIVRGCQGLARFQALRMQVTNLPAFSIH